MSATPGMKMPTTPVQSLPLRSATTTGTRFNAAVAVRAQRAEEGTTFMPPGNPAGTRPSSNKPVKVAARTTASMDFLPSSLQ